MSSTPRATATATEVVDTSARWPRRSTLWARRRRPWLPVVWFVTLVAFVVTIELSGGKSLLRLAVTMVFFAVTAMRNSRDFAVLDAGASLLLRRRTEFTEEIIPTEVTSDQIVCIRPRHPNLIVRVFRPEMWQVGEHRLIVDSKRLSSLLAHHAKEDSPS